MAAEAKSPSPASVQLRWRSGAYVSTAGAVPGRARDSREDLSPSPSAQPLDSALPVFSCCSQGEVSGLGRQTGPEPGCSLQAHLPHCARAQEDRALWLPSAALLAPRTSLTPLLPSTPGAHTDPTGQAPLLGGAFEMMKFQPCSPSVVLFPVLSLRGLFWSPRKVSALPCCQVSTSFVNPEMGREENRVFPSLGPRQVPLQEAPLLSCRVCPALAQEAGSSPCQGFLPRAPTA